MFSRATTTLLILTAPIAAQTTFDNDRTLATPAPPGLLTEGYPGSPVVAITPAMMGLLPADEVDALSFGDDEWIQDFHAIVFSVDPMASGVPGSGVEAEFFADTAPGVSPAAAGDIFLQELTFFPGNMLAPPGFGYDAGTTDGDEANASWGTPCTSAGCEDLDAFDYSAPALATGVYFSVRPGSPVLGALGATPGDILYSDLTGAPPIIAMLAGAGPATAGNLGIAGLDLDALNVVGTTGPIGSGGGVILPGPLGPSLAGPPPPSTHLVQYSVGSFTGFDGAVLERVGPGAFAIHTPDLALGLTPNMNLNALEASPPAPCVLPATVSTYNGTGINRDVLTSTPVVIGSVFTATIVPQQARAAGPWVTLLRMNPSAGPAIDWGLFFVLPPAGISELLVGAGFIANISDPSHFGGGVPDSVSLTVPNNCALVGMPWYGQSLVMGDLPSGGGVLDPWWSTAVMGVVGTF